MSKDAYEAGAAVMKQLFGREPDAGALGDDFMKITVEHLFGNIWNRPGLAIQERSLVTVTALTVLGRENEMRVHMRGAVNLGIPREKLVETMIHLAHYAGWPAAVNGLRILREVFDRVDAKK